MQTACTPPGIHTCTHTNTHTLLSPSGMSAGIELYLNPQFVMWNEVPGTWTSCPSDISTTPSCSLRAVTRNSGGTEGFCDTQDPACIIEQSTNRAGRKERTADLGIRLEKQSEVRPRAMKGLGCNRSVSGGSPARWWGVACPQLQGRKVTQADSVLARGETEARRSLQWSWWQPQGPLCVPLLRWCGPDRGLTLGRIVKHIRDIRLWPQTMAPQEPAGHLSTRFLALSKAP